MASRIKLIFFGIFLFFTVSNIFSKDKIFLKSGDVYFMTVEKIKNQELYISDNLNHMKIPITLVEHIEYDKNSFVQKQLKKIEKSIRSKKYSGSDWKISHYDTKYVYLYNKSTSIVKKIKWHEKKVNPVNKKHSIQWGVAFNFQNFYPKVTSHYELNSSWLLGANIFNKNEFHFKMLSFFFSFETLYGSFISNYFNQGIHIGYLMPSIHLSIFSNNFFRFYIQNGLGFAYLNTYNILQEAKEITLLTTFRIGFEVFVLSYLSFQFSAGYQTYWQDLSMDSLSGFVIHSTIGYYF